MVRTAPSCLKWKRSLAMKSKRCNVIKMQVDSEKMSADDSKEYQSVVRMLLFLVKHSKPDITNAIRGHQKQMMACCELLQVIRYVQSTKILP